jgi:hypothetical protein
MAESSTFAPGCDRIVLLDCHHRSSPTFGPRVGVTLAASSFSCPVRTPTYDIRLYRPPCDFPRAA